MEVHTITKSKKGAKFVVIHHHLDIACPPSPSLLSLSFFLFFPFEILSHYAQVSHKLDILLLQLPLYLICQFKSILVIEKKISYRETMFRKTKTKQKQQKTPKDKLI